MLYKNTLNIGRTLLKQIVCFLNPKYWCLHFIFFFLRILVYLPYHWQVNIGITLGRITYPFLKRRRHITVTNLKIAFPQKSEIEIKLLCKKCFESIGISCIETAMAWFMPNKLFKKITFHTHGFINFEKAHENCKRGTLLLGSHFMSMEIIGRFIGNQYSRFSIVYQKHKNSLFEHVMTTSRQAYVSQCLQRKNVLSIVNSLKRGGSVWYAPDQDFGSERTIFVPLFGKECATLTATSWLAKITGAQVVPCYYTRKSDFSGYDIHVLPPFDDFPSGNDYKDALRYHRILEKAILDFPEQYLWQHRRYKTRPPGQKDIY